MPNAQVQYGRADLHTRGRGRFKFKLDLTEPSSVLLSRVTNNATELKPMADDTWVEVYRTRTTAKWYTTVQLAEGVNCTPCMGSNHAPSVALPERLSP